MAQLSLNGLENRVEILDISGKGITFKTISIPNENCSNFQIIYEIKNGTTFNGPIHCLVSPYQRDISRVKLNKSILIPDNSTFSLRLHSQVRQDFMGESTLDYEIFELAPKRVFISETDRQNAYRVALVNLARFFNIPNWENDNNQTLYDRLNQVKNPIINLLQAYFSAYNNWFEFYMGLKNRETATGQGHDLAPTESQQLSELIQRRQNTLNALQVAFDELQFNQFRRSHGLENIDGINL